MEIARMKIRLPLRPLAGLAALAAFIAMPVATRGADKPDRLAAPYELLYPDGAPGAVGKEEADKPGLWLFPADAKKANGAAVVVCPGGGYGHLAIHHEGEEVARWLNSLGVSAYVLKYRLAPRYRHPSPLDDAQRALRMVRAKAASKEWAVDPKRVGLMGFSAGGHLTSTAGTHFDLGKSDSSDPIESQSCRPDFLILGYPVITFDPTVGHSGSRDNLLGKNPDPKLTESLCNDKQVTAETPPTFLFHTNEDGGVIPENSVLFYLALRRAKVPCEMHIYEKGPHGVGLAAKDPVLSTWSGRCADWLAGRGVLKAGE
jgi:acetyl esterase/lipase